MEIELASATYAHTRSRLQGVVLDMDGVIVDSHPAHRFAWREFLRTLGREVSDTELDFVMEGRKRNEILVHFLGPLTDRQLEQYGKLKNELFWCAAVEVAPIPGVETFVESIREAGMVAAVATSASTSRARSILTRLGLLTHFTAITTGEDVRLGKPDPGIYSLACQRMNCPPHAVVAFEDAVAGVQAANGAGLKCIGIASRANGAKLAAAGADCVLPNFLNLSVQELHSLVGIRVSP